VSKSSKSISKLIRLASQSFAFEQYLKYNPKAAKRAIRDRDQVVLEFLHLSIPPRFEPLYQPLTIFIRPQLATCGDSAPISLAGRFTDKFIFYGGPDTNAALFEVKVDDGSDLIIHLHDLSNDFAIAVAKPCVLVFISESD